MRKFTAKQAEFIRQFPKTFNATVAARAAGYAPKSARVAGARLLAKDNVRAELRAQAERRSKRLELSVDQIVMELIELARDPDFPAGARVQAYTTICRHLGMLHDKLDLTTAGLPITHFTVEFIGSAPGLEPWQTGS